ncbi:hypothetical protein BU26DRAFT_554706 [Trematosphaeria pertusa]|uniref:Uncharacterized protein n=1 Tax=Trematosphaeria pertusa TaxID=390896 RepID=A0A6A6I1Q3_9PLEO|nr:uncharacterized protein BU26DRAFT_554706 [Trematosphaeria pertusa]KAF2243938.1 hypothetical protein BU26DRAFT_554706 [Trematosphaeria pertusa]
MARNPGPIRRLWYSWKMMQLPWRRRWLVGFDLEGNTYWEFKDALHSHRNRRIVKYGRRTHYGDVAVPPPWMQWLRHTRFEPPTVAEQRSDVFRQQRIKMLAQEADARWAAKPSVLDAPDKQQPVQPLESRDPNAGIRQMNADQEVRGKAEPQRTVEEEDVASKAAQTNEAPALKTRRRMRTEPKDSPWNQAAKGNPGDEWQPQSWTPGSAKRRA